MPSDELNPLGGRGAGGPTGPTRPTGLTGPTGRTTSRPRVRALILTGFGLNCEAESARAFELAGATAEQVHLNDLLDGRRALDDFHVLDRKGRSVPHRAESMPSRQQPRQQLLPHHPRTTEYG